jgi:EAL domain-containing protein (putative c-di-GMP-specific phosphodiesterase class I)
MPGLSKERDDYLSGIMIDLAKKMNMTVVQEGVENEEMFSRIVSMGVDVVQGYYYAKPIPLEEYRIFLNTNTSIKYKSKVK